MAPHTEEVGGDRLQMGQFGEMGRSHVAEGAASLCFELFGRARSDDPPVSMTTISSERRSASLEVLVVSRMVTP